MRVCHFTEMDRFLSGGIKSSIRHQRKALADTPVEVTKNPYDDHDVLHLNLIGPRSAYHLLRARRNGTPVVFHVHSTGEDFRHSFRFSNLLAPAFDRYARGLYNRADMLLPVSRYTRDYLREGGVDVPMDVISNGVEADKLDGYDDLDGVREKHDVRDLAVVNLGFVFERKGLSDYVSVADRFPDLDFRWFGKKMSGLFTSRTTNRAVRRAPDNVRFTGFVEDVREAFATGDIFFFPSHAEHQPIALLEALYCGMPIVLRDIPQFEGWLEHGTHCLKGDSVDEFAAHIERLRDDPELREELGQNAAALGQEHTLTRVGTHLQDVYSTVIDTA